MVFLFSPFWYFGRDQKTINSRTEPRQQMLLKKGLKDMKKEDLVKLGLNDETAQKVADAIAEEMKGFIPKNRFDEVNESNKTLKTQIADRDKQLEELKKVDAAGLNAKIAELQEENKKAKQTHDAQINEMRRDYAIESALREAKAKNIKAVRALLNLDEITIDGEKINGIDKQIKALTESEETKFLFNVQDPKFKGMQPPQNPDPHDPNTNNISAAASYAQKYSAKFAPQGQNNNQK